MAGKRFYRLMPDNFKGGGVVRYMTTSEYHVMVRRPGCAPFIVTIAEWASWPPCDAKGAHLDA